MPAGTLQVTIRPPRRVELNSREQPIQGAVGRAEVVSWIACALLMNVLYGYGAFVSGSDPFGIDALRAIGPAMYAVCLTLLVALAFVASGVATAEVTAGGGRALLSRPAVAFVVSLLSFPLFYSLRTNVLNADGSLITPKIEAGVAHAGAFMTHDELLEFFVHSRGWYYAHRLWGWSVPLTYQVLSCAAGAAFVYALVRLASRLSPGKSSLFVLGVLGSGFMQLFFGDIENYTVTAAIVVFYAIAGCRFLAGEVGLWMPTVVLATAICFHLESGWLLPGLAYLFEKSRAREGTARTAIESAALGFAVIAAVFVYFHFNGLPLRQFFSSHAGYLLRGKSMLAFGMPGGYYIEQLRLLLLLCPAVLVAIPLLAWRRAEFDEPATFLGISAASMLLFQATWKAQLGVHDDWNLYAIGGMVIALCVWQGVTRFAKTRPMRVAAIVLAGTGWIHTYAWIVSNHRHGR